MGLVACTHREIHPDLWSREKQRNGQVGGVGCAEDGGDGGNRVGGDHVNTKKVPWLGNRVSFVQVVSVSTCMVVTNRWGRGGGRGRKGRKRERKKIGKKQGKKKKKRTKKIDDVMYFLRPQ